MSVEINGASSNEEGVRFVVLDANTGEPLPFANIFAPSDAKRKLTANKDGLFTLPKGKQQEWKISVSGYETQSIYPDYIDTLVTIRMNPTEYELEEVVINPGKEKYKKKNNPAVEFVKRLRSLANENNPEKEKYYSYNKYEKTLIGLNDFNYDFKKGVSKSGNIFKACLDTSNVTGKKILDLILKERVSTMLTGQEVNGEKEVIRAYRSCGADEVINQENMRIILEDAVREINIFDNDITLLQNRFVSPLSAIGPDFYKYYLSDTVFLGEEKCIELSFVPHNPQSMGFNGKIYVPLDDTTMFVKKVILRTPGAMNMNLLDNIFINLTFEKDSLGNRQKTYDDVCIEFSLIPQLPKLYGRKTTYYSDFSYEPSGEFSKIYEELGNEFSEEEAWMRDDEYWISKRPIRLSYGETALGGMMDEARKNKFIYYGEKALRLLESGYVPTGKPSRFDIGPITSFISYNTVEGLRLKFGGMTMAALNPHIFLSGYIAYGTRDKKIKYDLSGEYSFLKKKKHSYEWPRHSITAQARYDVDMLGQHYLSTSPDNVFLSIKRKESILATYQRLFRIGYVLELQNNFSLEGSIKSERQESTKWIPFDFSSGKTLGHYTQNSLSISLRYAPGERFIQGRGTRKPVNMDAWIFQITHEYGPKNLLHSNFTLNATEIMVQKRFWFSAFGYTDLKLRGGKLWSKVYYPALMWPNANLTYTIQRDSYSLMNPMEFANDEYCSLDMTYFGMGALFNRIPFIKKLKLREVVTFKGLMGHLTDKNNPDLNDDLPLFPGYSATRTMSSTPYMEAGIGIDNILMFLRLDYVWRLTYRDAPGIDKSGVRVSLHFSF